MSAMETSWTLGESFLLPMGTHFWLLRAGYAEENRLLHLVDALHENILVRSILCLPLHILYKSLPLFCTWSCEERFILFIASSCFALQVLQRAVPSLCFLFRFSSHCEKSFTGKPSLHSTHGQIPRVLSKHARHLRSVSSSFHIHAV